MQRKTSKKNHRQPITLRLCPSVLASLKREAGKTGLTMTRIIEGALKTRLAFKP